MRISLGAFASGLFLRVKKCEIMRCECGLKRILILLYDVQEYHIKRGARGRALEYKKGVLVISIYSILNWRCFCET